MVATRILYVITSPLSTRLMRGQLRYLSQRGYEVMVASGPGKELETAAREEQFQAIVAPLVREISPWADLVALFRLWALVRRVRPEITNVSTPKAGLLGGMAAFMNRVPCRVYTLRGLRWETASGFRRKVLLMAEWIACHCAHRVICVSQSVSEKVVAAGLVGPERIVVLGAGSSNGVDSGRFEPTPDRQARAAALRQRLAIPPEALVTGYVGRLTCDKGISELYAAHVILRAQFPSLRLLLVGDFEDEDPLPASVRRSLQSDPSVLCAGFVDDVADFYQVFDVLALPSYREGFPNVVLEAQAAGRPVVSTCATGAVDAVVDGVTGTLVPAGNTDALAEALRALLSNPGLRAKMGAEGRARVRKDFNPETIWRALAEEYFQLLRAKGLPLPCWEMLSSNIAKEIDS